VGKRFRERLKDTLGQWKERIQPLLDDLNQPMSTTVRGEIATGQGGKDYALIAMTTGIVGFTKDNTPIIRPKMIDPAMQNAFRTDLTLQHMIVNLLEAEFGVERAEIGKQIVLGRNDENTWVRRTEKPVDEDMPPLPPQ